MGGLCGETLGPPSSLQASRERDPLLTSIAGDLGRIHSHIGAGFLGAARVQGSRRTNVYSEHTFLLQHRRTPSPPSSWASHFSPSKHSFRITSHNMGVSYVTHANDAWFINLPFHLILTASNVFPTEGFIAIQTHLRSFPRPQPSFIYGAHNFLSDFSHRQEWWHLDCPLTYLTTFSGVAESTAFVRH